MGQRIIQTIYTCDACGIGVMIAKNLYGTDTIENEHYSRWAMAGASSIHDPIAEKQAASIGMSVREAFDLNTVFEAAYDRNYSIEEGCAELIKKMETMVEYEWVI